MPSRAAMSAALPHVPQALKAAEEGCLPPGCMQAVDARLSGGK